MVDTGVLSDRAVAERAGLGFTGRNGFVISPELGTWSYLGEMLVSIPFEPDDPLLDSCVTAQFVLIAVQQVHLLEMVS